MAPRCGRSPSTTTRGSGGREGASAGVGGRAGQGAGAETPSVKGRRGLRPAACLARPDHAKSLPMTGMRRTSHAMASDATQAAAPARSALANGWKARARIAMLAATSTGVWKHVDAEAGVREEPRDRSAGISLLAVQRDQAEQNDAQKNDSQAARPPPASAIRRCRTSLARKRPAEAQEQEPGRNAQRERQVQPDRPCRPGDGRRNPVRPPHSPCRRARCTA